MALRCCGKQKLCWILKYNWTYIYVRTCRAILDTVGDVLMTWNVNIFSIEVNIDRSYEESLHMEGMLWNFVLWPLDCSDLWGHCAYLLSQPESHGSFWIVSCVLFFLIASEVFVLLHWGIKSEQHLYYLDSLFSFKQPFLNTELS